MSFTINNNVIKSKVSFYEFHSKIIKFHEKLMLTYLNRQLSKKVLSNMDDNSLKSFKWCPGGIKNISNTGAPNLKYVCMILNREIRIPSELVKNIWENAHLRLMVDGGANRWRQFLIKHCQSVEMKRPDLITGDFDSITDETIEYFKTTKRVHTPDQNETDFTKAIDVVRPFLKKHQIDTIIVFHDSSGRFDHIMANINTLYKAQSPMLNIYLLSNNSMTWLLRPGKHSICIPADLVERQSWCALIPIGETAKKVTTRGLRWNLNNDELKFGGLISSSNTYALENIEIDTNSCLIWSMGLFCFDDTC